jgi:hypothetical protein
MHSASNEPSGDAFTNKPREAFRLWSVNANGISSRDGFAALHTTLCVSLASGFVDAVALQEPNVDFMQADIRQKYEDIFKEHFGQARVITATTCISAPNAWKPGGVVLAILGSWAQHVTRVSGDKLGHWASATLLAPTAIVSRFTAYITSLTLNCTMPAHQRYFPNNIVSCDWPA